MTRNSSSIHDPMSRDYLHSGAQRKFKFGAIVVAILVALIAIPLLVNPELRLDVARQVGFVAPGDGELVAEADSGATLIVIPTAHKLENTSREQLRFLAAFTTWPEPGGMRLHPLNGGRDFTVPLSSYDLVSASPDGTAMYMAGPEGGVLVDVPGTQVIATLAPGEEPGVDWDWRTAVWQHHTFICDRVSNQAAWIGCFERPELASYFVGDWQLTLEKYGPSEEKHEVMRGLGFQPIVGFTADDAWLYVFNERGIRRFDVAEVTGSGRGSNQ